MSAIRFLRDWNQIIRTVLFQDTRLKELMLIPEGTNIISFIDRYFVRAGYTNNLLTNEHVRIVYGDTGARDTEVPNVKRSELSFDIFVKQEDEHNADYDRLMLRSQLISARLIYLLTHKRYLGGYRFIVRKEQDMGTRTQGYIRHNVSFWYMKVY